MLFSKRTILGALFTGTLAARSDPCQKLANSFAPRSNTSDLIVNIANLAPEGSSFEGNSLATGYNTKLTELPAHCRIAAQFNTSSNSTVHLEVWMPVAPKWNRRFLAVGNGGWAGGINYADVARGLKQNFATMSMNGGHNSSSGDGSWFQYEEQSIDYGHRALHGAVIHAKEVVHSYYSAPASWSYYNGCSTGGRQGFAEVQRYPDDFDGALIGSPVIWQTHEEAYENYVGIGQYPNTTDTFIEAEKWPIIHAEAVSQCDLLDGVEDGLISDPFRCQFIPETLLCSSTSPNKTACLTPPQLENLRRMYRGWTDVNNTLVWPGVPVGSELTGLMAYTNADVGGGYGLDFYRYGILNDTSFISTDITYEDVKIAEKVDSYGGISDAFSPNLSAFHAHGGKILHYHGGQDSIVNTGISPLYYSNVLSFFASLGSHTQTKVPDFYRLFMVPGLGHCDGGDGAWVIGATGTFLPTAKNDTAHSALLALIAWREDSKAPEALVGTKYANETVVNDTPVDLTIDFTRPSCLWPSIPQYQGGNVSEASSWGCPSPLL